MKKKTNSKKKNAHADLIKHDEGDLDLQFVGEEAGDIQMSEERQAKHADLKRQLGDMFYADLVFALTNKQYPSYYSKQLWQRILHHKATLIRQLKRNPGISVAAHDYLSNIKDVDEELKVIPEEKLGAFTDIAIKDGLTSLYDHATFQAKLKEEVSRFNRYGTQVSLIMLDIDHFKHYNDRFGHQSGDKLLMELSTLLLDDCRDVDIVCRYGGEEFVIILPATSSREGFQLAERLRLDIRKRFKGKSVTVSLGIANCPDHAESRDALVRAADKALYKAKNQGRNNSQIAVKES
ncbi:MAG: GGDEF domain-containing protein [Desulfobulbaceae bacterium]|nr:GGDEF domain-containing protein [Desulfobulbaceae bacterium]